MKFAFSYIMTLNLIWSLACLFIDPDVDRWFQIAWISTILMGLLTIFIACNSVDNFWCCYYDLNLIISLYKKFLTVLLSIFYVEYRLGTMSIWTITTIFLWTLLLLSVFISINIEEEEKKELEVELAKISSPRRRVSYLDE